MKRLLGAAICLIILLTIYSVADAARKETSKVLEGGRIITAEETKSLVDKKAASLFDMRKAINYGKGHIPSAVSAPYKWDSSDVDVTVRTGKFDMSKLPEDKNTTIIFYSDGPTGWKSFKASTDAINAGYKNVLYFRGGFATWESKEYPVEH